MFVPSRYICLDISAMQIELLFKVLFYLGAGEGREEAIICHVVSDAVGIIVAVLFVHLWPVYTCTVYCIE